MICCMQPEFLDRITMYEDAWQGTRGLAREFEPAKRTLGVSLSPRGLPRVAPRHPQWDGASARPLVYVRLTIVID